MNLLAPGAVVLVTGATGGIGSEIAAQAAAEGAVVAVHGSRRETVDAAIAKLAARFPEARFIAAPGDFQAPGVIEAVIEKVAAEGGRLDAVIHCATNGGGGGKITGPLMGTDPDAYAGFASRALATFQRLCFASIPHLARQRGTIIAFASDSGRFASPRQSLVGAAFGGLMAFVRNLSVEVAREGVRVHCISPSYVAETPVFDAYTNKDGRAESAFRKARLGLPTPRDIAPMTLFLCGPGAEKITGQIISINGGMNA